jgi:hypothetical protein
LRALWQIFNNKKSFFDIWKMTIRLDWSICAIPTCRTLARFQCQKLYRSPVPVAVRDLRPKTIFLTNQSNFTKFFPSGGDIQNLDFPLPKRAIM